MEIGLASPWIRRYLEISRGAGWECCPKPKDLLLEVFRDCLESWEHAGFSVENIRLIPVYSRAAQFETVRYSNISYVVYDQAFSEVFNVLNYELFRARNPGDSYREVRQNKPPPWLLAIYANRFMFAGHRFEAYLNACGYAEAVKRSEENYEDLDHDRLVAWRIAQECFALLHEIGHCRVGGAQKPLAHLITPGFDELIRPLVRQVDSHRRLTTAPRERREPKDFLVAAGIDNNYSQDALDYLDERLNIPDMPSLENQLNAMLANPDGIHEEILCDYLAVNMVLQTLGDDLLAADECLSACFAASLFTQLWRQVEASIEHFNTTPPFQYLTSFLTDLFRRSEFLKIMCQTLSQRDEIRKLRRNNAGADHWEDAQTRRGQDLAAELSSINEIFWERFVPHIALSGVVSKTNILAISLKDDEARTAILDDPNLDKFIAKTTGIGGKQEKLRDYVDL